MPSSPLSRYYEGGVSSVYLWDLEDGGFAGVVLLKKSMTPSSPSEPAGSWDSIHVFETAERGRQVCAVYHQSFLMPLLVYWALSLTLA